MRVTGSFRKLVGPLLILAAGAGGAFLLSLYVREDVERDARQRFDRQAADAKHIIERRLRSYVGITYGLQALFAANDSLSKAEFGRYVTSLGVAKNYPGFEVLNYAKHIRLGEKRKLEEEMRREDPKFTIRPPGDRTEYHVLVYLEPMKGNEFAFGLDIGTTGAPGRAIERIRDTGELISSGRLLRAKDGYVGLAMRLAVYRNGATLNTVEERRAAFIGTVGAGYNVRKLMAGVLDETTMVAMRYRLYDRGAIDQERGAGAGTGLLFDNAQAQPGIPEDDFLVHGLGPLFETVLPLQLAGRSWELHFSAPKSAFIERSDVRLPWIAMGGGLLLSVLLFVVLYSLASSRQRAEALAAEITKELRESEASLAHAQSLARLGSWTLEPQSGAMTWSAETYRMLGLDPAAAEPRREAFLAWMREEDRGEFARAIERCLRSGAPASLELALHAPRGEARWVHLLLQPAGARVRGTIMDVTERKRALEAQRASAAQIRDLLRRLVSAQEAERRRYSANLHDLVGQSLSVIGIGLETLRGMLAGTAPRSTEATIGDMGRVVRETMGAVREVMSDLRPPLLDDYGLYTALEWHAQQFTARTGVPVALEGVLERRPAPEVELALFRIAQEALTNVAKHAGAARATVALSAADGRVRLVVEDDGRGIAETGAANDPAAPGWGMAVMRERAVAVGGTMRVESPGRGTRVVVEVAA